MSKNLDSVISMGLINFTNCLPINYSLYQLVSNRLILSEGYPTLINQLMEDKQVHVAPISSIEYIKHSDRYELIESACIASDGDVASVILFSNYDFEDLEEKIVGIPYTSSSSVALLKILLNEHQFDISRIKFQKHKYEHDLDQALNGIYDAILYIGDPALVANINYPDKFKKYDLGRMWKELTGYPMTFGTWVAQSDWKSSQKDDFEWVNLLLTKAVEDGLTIYFNEVIEIASKNLNLEKIHIEDYLTNKIQYNFTDRHKEGLELFKSLYSKLDKRSEDYLKV